MIDKELTDLLQSVELANSQTKPVSMVAPDNSSTKETFERLKYLCVTFMLNDHKFRQHLIADGHFVVLLEANMKAAFRIDESDDPVCR